MNADQQIQDVRDINIKLDTEPKRGEEKSAPSELPAKDDKTKGKTEDIGLTNFLTKANHPVVCVVHLLFRSLAILW